MAASKKPRVGKSADDLFAATADTTVTPVDNPTSARRGRPPRVGKTTKVTVTLRDSQIVYLDQVANDIRASTTAAIKRAELIRAMIDVVEEVKIDFTAATSEEAVRDILRDHLSD